KDADFAWSEFQARVNSELADILGNFVNRALTFAHRYFDGVVPALVDPSDLDRDVLRQLAAFPGTIGAAYERFRIREAVQETMNLARLGNKYLDDAAPWHSRKTDPQAAANTIHIALQLCAALAVLMDPILPFSAERVRKMLKLKHVRNSDAGGGHGTVGWAE